MSKKENKNLIEAVLSFFIDQPLFTFMFCLAVIIAGLFVLPYELRFTADGGLLSSPKEIAWQMNDRKPVPVDAIPDLGENQQIVFTEWPGRTPRDVEDQLTYPLSLKLQGIPGVKSLRSYSYFGFSLIYVIFEEGIDFYEARNRVLEKTVNSRKSLPEGVEPSLGPDATGLGQVFMYTLEGKGFDLQELRTIQDWYVRYALQGADGVSEVSSIGGFVREYHVEIDPYKLQESDISLAKINEAIRSANIDIGARTLEENSVEYLIRGLGFIKSIGDLEAVVLRAEGGTSLQLGDVAKVTLGPALRRGILDWDGEEKVGGIVVARYGENPMEVIKNVKTEIEEVKTGLPQKILASGESSKVDIKVFYDRSKLIKQTLATLSSAIFQQILITVLVVLMMLRHLRTSMLLSLLVPLGVLMTFILMSLFKVDSNIMSLSGIAIAIGTMVDMGVIVTENLSKIRADDKDIRGKLKVQLMEVAPAVITAILTTIISFLPIFLMTGAEGKLFIPLAFTKTFALFSSVLLALIVLPALSEWFLFRWNKAFRYHYVFNSFLLVFLVLPVFLFFSWRLGLVLLLFFVYQTASVKLKKDYPARFDSVILRLSLVLSLWLLSLYWQPLGLNKGFFFNALFNFVLIFGIIYFFDFYRKVYPRILTFALAHRFLFLSLPLFLLLSAITLFLGFEKTFIYIFIMSFVWIMSLFKIYRLHKVFDSKLGQWLTRSILTFMAFLGLWWTLSSVLPKALKIQANPVYVLANHSIPGFGKEFMPSLDEGSFLYMPTSMPHSSLAENAELIRLMDSRIAEVPEVENVIGKLGRADSALDPAPISMYESIIHYKEEYRRDEATGKQVRQWRDHIQSSDDIWEEIVEAADIPGITSAPKLQPISARLVMLQSGMRAPMGIKIKGTDLQFLEKTGLAMEEILKAVPGVAASAVLAERVVGKPYLEIQPDRRLLASYNLSVQDFMMHINTAIGGKKVTRTIEGREQYDVIVRFQRETRDSISALQNLPVSLPGGTSIPLRKLATVEYRPGPQVIKSEGGFLLSYLLFDKRAGYSEVDVVEDVESAIQTAIHDGRLKLDKGTHYEFAGNYQNQVRSQKTLALVVPLALAMIFFLLYLQFKSVAMSFILFSSIAVALSGGMIMLFLYSQGWFLNFEILGVNLQEVFQVKTYYLSVAVWVGFLALFGIASDDGVVLATYIQQKQKKNKIKTREDIDKIIIEAGRKRILPCMVTTATTSIALLPVLTSSGRGSDVMIPMALPLFGGMAVALLSIYVVPILSSYWMEFTVFKRTEMLSSLDAIEKKISHPFHRISSLFHYNKK